MPQDFRTFSFRGCSYGEFPETIATISASVGEGGENDPDDTTTIQTLLNNVPITAAGPHPLLAVDGKVGRLTIGAIRKFQARHLGWSDGRVDPDGPTLPELHSFSPNPDADGLDRSNPNQRRRAHVSVMAETIRRATAISVLPDARKVIRKTLLELDLVVLKLTKQALQIEDIFRGTGPEQRAFRVFNQHFAISKLSTNAARKSLDFVRMTYATMRATLDQRPGFFGGDPFGANMVEVDPITEYVPKLEHAFAYSPLQTANQQKLRRLGVTPYRIYFTNLIDKSSRDFYLYAVIHELAHFVDDEKKVMIQDHAYGWENRYQTLPHALRIRNADCYSAAAFDLALGNTRLAAIYPQLRVIELDPVIIR